MMRFLTLAISVLAFAPAAFAQLPQDSLSRLYLTACYTGMVEAQKVLPDLPQKDELLRRGYVTCDGSVMRLAATGELRRESDVGLFACGYALGAMFAKYGLGGEVNPPSKRLTRGYIECQSLLWQRNMLSAENRRRFAPAALRQLLRNLVIAEEIHFAEHFADSVRYTENVAHLELLIPLGVTVSVKLLGDGYRAAATHSTSTTCYIFLGTQAAIPGHKEGQPWCDPDALTAAPLLAQTVSPGAGVSFQLPSGLTVQQGRPAPVTMSWTNAAGTVSVDAMVIGYPNGNVGAAAREFQDWPGVGRSMAASFGNSSARVLGEVYHVACTYEGIPLSHDPQRMALQIRVDVTCPTSPQPVVTRSLVLNAMTLSGEVWIRIDAPPPAFTEQNAIANEIWRTMTVAESQRVVADYTPSGSTRRPVRPVVGGPGFRLTDYGLIRPAAIIAQLVGAIIGAIVFGALLTLVLMKARLQPLAAVLISQLILIALGLWGGERDGVWELNWLVSFPSAIVATLVLRPWANRRLQRQQGTLAGTAPRADGSSRRNDTGTGTQ
jgi:hypothetical protein